MVLVVMMFASTLALESLLRVSSTHHPRRRATVAHLWSLWRVVSLGRSTVPSAHLLTSVPSTHLLPPISSAHLRSSISSTHLRPPVSSTSIRRAPLGAPWSTSAIEVVRPRVPALALRVTPAVATIAVALVREMVRLLLGHLMRLVAVNVVEALGLNEAVNFGGGDAGEHLLHEGVRRLFAGFAEVRFVGVHGCEAGCAGDNFVRQLRVMWLVLMIRVLIMHLCIVLAEHL